MGSRNSTKMVPWLVLVILVLVVGFVWRPNLSIGGTTTPPTTPVAPNPTPSGGVQCPTTLTTSEYFDVYNPLNLTGSENYDVTAYLYKVENGQESLVQTITDTTAASTAISLDCGKQYILKPIATDAASGDGSKIQKIVGGTGTITPEGYLSFVATGGVQNYKLYIDQVATIQAKAYDNIAKGNMVNYTPDLLGATGYKGTGVAWWSTTNGTLYDETQGFDVTYTLQAIQTDTNFNDKGWYVLLKFATAKWDTPTVYVNGVKATNVKGSLDTYESAAWSAYDYVYFTNVDVLDGGDTADVRVVNQLKPGVAGATADVTIDFGAAGAYLSVDGVTVKNGAVKDDSGQTAVRTLFTSTVKVS